ncbi:MAG: RNA methyltransferase [Lautropia sp.]|nr:RNA methyltransferase [Lautropia sp.]
MAEPITLLSEALVQRTESPVEITSAANSRYRQLTELFESARARRRERLTVLEGWHLLDSWLMSPGPTPVATDADAPVQTRAPGMKARHAGPQLYSLVLPRRTWARVLAADPHEAGRTLSAATGPSASDDTALLRGQAALQALCAARWLVLDDRLFDSLDVLPSPAPLLALVPTPQPPLPDAIEGLDAVILDRVQDPGNVGAIIRTAAAAGIRLLITTPGTAACWAPKVLRAGMGGHFAMTMFESVPIDAVLARLKLPLVGTVVQPGRTISLYQADLCPPLAWVFGNEGEGIDVALRARLTQGVTIPQTDGVESLNVAAAAAVCLFEQRRQRLG